MIRVEHVLKESAKSGVHYHPELVKGYLMEKRRASNNIAPLMTLESWISHASSKDNYKHLTENVAVDLNIQLNPNSRYGTRFRVTMKPGWYEELCSDISQYCGNQAPVKLTYFNENDEIRDKSATTLSKLGPITVRYVSVSPLPFDGCKTPICPEKYATTNVVSLRATIEAICQSTFDEVADRMGSLKDWNSVKEFVRGQCKRVIEEKMHDYVRSNRKKISCHPQHLATALTENVQSFVVSTVSNMRAHLSSLFDAKQDINNKIQSLEQLIQASMHMDCRVARARKAKRFDDGLSDSEDDEDEESETNSTLQLSIPGNRILLESLLSEKTMTSINVPDNVAFSTNSDALHHLKQLEVETSEHIVSHLLEDFTTGPNSVRLRTNLLNLIAMPKHSVSSKSEKDDTSENNNNKPPSSSETGKEEEENNAKDKEAEEEGDQEEEEEEDEVEDKETEEEGEENEEDEEEKEEEEEKDKEAEKKEKEEPKKIQQEKEKYNVKEQLSSINASINRAREQQLQVQQFRRRIRSAANANNNNRRHNRAASGKASTLDREMPDVKVNSYMIQ